MDIKQIADYHKVLRVVEVQLDYRVLCVTEHPQILREVSIVLLDAAVGEVGRSANGAVEIDDGFSWFKRVHLHHPPYLRVLVRVAVSGPVVSHQSP